MGSKFINSGNSNDLTAVTDGSLDILGASLGSQNLTPGFPIKIDAERKLYSTALAIADVVNLQAELDATIQTPYPGTIEATDFKTDTTSISALENKTQNITAVSGTTNLTGNIIVSGGTEQISTISTTIAKDKHECKKAGGVFNGNSIYQDLIYADDNTGSSNNVALIRYSADENHTATERGTDIGLWTTSRGSTVPSERLSIDADGATRITGDLTATGDIGSSGVNTQTIKTDIITNVAGLQPMYFGPSTIEIAGNLDVKSMNTLTKLITLEADFGTPVGNFYVLTDGVNYRIQGTVTMTYGIKMGAGCSICGDGLNAIVLFDETSRDCQIKSELGQQVLISDLQIVNGGGRNSGLSTIGLFDCVDIDTATGVFPFFGRSMRFYLNNVSTLKVFNHGFVQGFGTISVNNCFWNGGAGLSGQPESYYTNYGISFQAGLSCEFNNNKLVLFRGAYFTTTEPMVRLGSDLIVGINSVGFNAVEISDNILHPRGTERGLFVAADCSTALGNIGNNVFISETSTVLIDYGASTDESKGSYNTPNMIKYIVNSNAGIPDSQVSLHSNWTTTLAYSSASLQTIELGANSEMSVQKVSNRIGVRMNITTTAGFWVTGLIQQPITGATANILYVESANVVFISDQNGIQFDAGQQVIQSGFATTGNAPTLATEYIFVEKEPRRVGLMAMATCEVAGSGDDINFTVGYDVGVGFVDDLDGQAESFASNNKPNQVIYISVKQLKFGDKFHLRVATAGAAQLEISKIHIGIS